MNRTGSCSSCFTRTPTSAAAKHEEQDRGRLATNARSAGYPMGNFTFVEGDVTQMLEEVYPEKNFAAEARFRLV